MKSMGRSSLSETRWAASELLGGARFSAGAHSEGEVCGLLGAYRCVALEPSRPENEDDSKKGVFGTLRLSDTYLYGAEGWGFHRGW
jgi:hypothetical protein